MLRTIKSMAKTGRELGLTPFINSDERGQMLVTEAHSGGWGDCTLLLEKGLKTVQPPAAHLQFTLALQRRSSLAAKAQVAPASPHLKSCITLRRAANPHLGAAPWRHGRGGDSRFSSGHWHRSCHSDLSGATHGVQGGRKACRALADSRERVGQAPGRQPASMASTLWPPTPLS